LRQGEVSIGRCSLLERDARVFFRFLEALELARQVPRLGLVEIRAIGVAGGGQRLLVEFKTPLHLLEIDSDLRLGLQVPPGLGGSLERLLEDLQAARLIILVAAFVQSG